MDAKWSRLDILMHRALSQVAHRLGEMTPEEIESLSAELVDLLYVAVEPTGITPDWMQ